MSLLDPARLAHLASAGLLDDVARGVTDETLDRLTRLAARLLGAPTALVTLVDGERQHVASAAGSAAPLASPRGTPLSHSFCRHVVDSAAPLVVEDARAHPLVCDNPGVAEHGVAACAGMPLTTAAGHVLGCLCVLDGAPRVWAPDDLAALSDLARAVTSHLELRATTRALVETSAVKERLVAMLEATPDFVGTATPDGRIAYLNRGGRRLLGLADDADLGMLRATDFHPPETLARLAADAFPAALRDGTWTGDVTLLDAGGAPVPVSLAMVAHPGRAPGEAPAFSALMRDLRERVAAQEALAGREAEHRALLAALPLIVYRVEPRPPYAPLYVSPGVAALGYTLEEWLAAPDTWLRVLHPDDRARVLAETEAALAAGRSVDYEYRVVAKDGSVRWIHDRGDFVRGAGGVPVAWQGIMLDVTERRAAEEARRLSEGRVRAIFETAAVGMSVIDDAGVVVKANVAFEAFLGYGPGELLGRYAPDLSPAEDGDVTRAPVADLRAGRIASATVEKRFVRRDGEVRWASLTLSRLALGDGREGVLGVTADVTDRKRAEQALERERAFLAAVLESLSDGVVACDAEGRLTLFNRATRTFHCLPADEGLPPEAWAARYGLHRGDGVTPLPADEVPLWRTLRGEEVRDAEIVIAPADGPAHAVRASGRQIRGADGELLGAVVAMRDVTEQVRAQAALAASEARLRAIYESAGVGVIVVDEARRVVQANAAFETFLGYDPGELTGRYTPELSPPDEADVTRGPVTELRAGRRSSATVEKRFVRRDGEVRWASITLSRLAAGDAVIAVTTDVTDRRRAEAALRESESKARLSEARFRTALDAMLDAFYILHPVRDVAGAVADYEIVEANAAGAALAGTALDDLVGIRIGELLPVARTSGIFAIYARVLETGEQYDGEYQTRDARSGAAWVRLQVVRTAEGLAVTSRDVSEKKRAEAALEELAVRDELTGLLNRRGFRQLAEQGRKVARRDGRRDAVLALDLNEFKAINDTYGHAAGDAALRSVAAVLRATLRETDVIARVGGDEFVVYAPMLQGAHEAHAVAARLRAALQAANAAAGAGGRPFAVEAAIGVAESEKNDDLDALLGRADAALYAAKRRAGGAAR